MRAWGLLLTGAFLIMMLPGATAQEVRVLAEDPTGDVALTAGDQATADGGLQAQLDLRSLAVEEQKDAILVTLQVADLSGGGKSDNTFQAYEVDFTADDTSFRVLGTFRGTEAYGVLYRMTSGEWFRVAPLYPTVDPSADTMSWAVPRDELVNSRGALPSPGWQLADFVVHSRSFQVRGCCTFGPAEVPVPDSRYGDRMPDDGRAQLPFEIQIGDRQTGHALLASDNPTRSSNGEATTFVFELVGHNTGASEDRFAVTTHGVPGAWDVIVPTPVVAIPGGGNVSIPVLVSTPFSHEHGSFESFRVQMQSLSDASATGRIEIGIRYTEIPQPTGHHDTVWFHAQAHETDEFETAAGLLIGHDFAVSAYMNAAEADGVAVDKPVRGNRGVSLVPSVPPTQTYSWYLPLRPGLDMGMDWDVTRTGLVGFSVASDLPLPAAVLSGSVMYAPDVSDGFRWGEDTFELAQLVPTEAVDVSGNHVFEAVLQPLPEADFIPWNKGANIWLDVRLSFLGSHAFLGPNVGPSMTGGHMQMPLREYRDPVDDIYSTVQGLVIHAATAQERLANPGEAVVFEFDLMDHGAGQGTFEVTLSGPNSAWAQVIGDKVIQVGAGANRRLAVGVLVPSDARDGDVADVVLQVTNRDDPSIRSLARFLVEVDTAADHDDETTKMHDMQGILTSKKDAPGPAIGLVVAAVALAGGARRAGRPRA